MAYSSECQQIQQINDGAVSPTGSDRISRLRKNENLEDAPSAMLKYLGEFKQPYLTAVEKKLLSLIEQEYGVN